MTRIHAADLLKWIDRSRMSEMGTDRFEVRMLSLVVVVVFMAQLVDVGIYSVFIVESLVHRVAGMFMFGADFMGALFFLAALMLVPHLVALSFFPSKLSCQWPRALAVRAGLLGSGGWLMLAYLSDPVDSEWLTTVFAARSFVDLVIAIIFGLSLNSQQLREQTAALLKAQRLKELAIAREGSGNEE